MSKSVVPFFRRFTKAKRIYRNININENTSELTLGYRFCNFLESIFVSNVKYCYRPKYYLYFDSWDELQLEDRPFFESELWPFPKLDMKYKFSKFVLNIKSNLAAKFNRFRYLKKIFRKDNSYTSTTTEV